MESFSFEKHVWAEIDLDALRANFAAVQRHAPGRPLCAVVKADAYGHGAVQCARALAQAGAAWLAVSCLAEAVQLRRAGLTLPILILGHVQPSYASALIQHQLTAACYSSEPGRRPEPGRPGRRGPGAGTPESGHRHGAHRFCPAHGL